MKPVNCRQSQLAGNWHLKFLKIEALSICDTADDSPTNKMFNRYAWQQQQHFLQPPFGFWPHLEIETCFMPIVSYNVMNSRNSFEAQQVRIKEGAPSRAPWVMKYFWLDELQTRSQAYMNRLCMHVEQDNSGGFICCHVSPGITSYPSVRDWTKSLLPENNRSVCVCGRVARQALQKVGWCTSPYPTSLEQSPAPEWLSATGLPEAPLAGEGLRKPNQIKAVAQRYTLSLSNFLFLKSG